MSDNPLDEIWRSFRDGWSAGAPGPSHQGVRSRPSFWNPFHSWRDEERRLLRRQYDDVDARFCSSPFMDGDFLTEVATRIVSDALEQSEWTPPASVFDAAYEVALHLIGHDFFSLPRYDERSWETSLSLEESAHLRALLERKQRILNDPAKPMELACAAVEWFLAACFHALPHHGTEIIDDDGTSDLAFDAMLVDLTTSIPTLIETAFAALFQADVFDRDLFHDVRRQLHHNLLVASGIDPDGSAQRTPPVIRPTEAAEMPAADLVALYLTDTPFHDFFASRLPLTVPMRLRFEHCHVIGGTGHGKTQLLQQLILSDLKQGSEDGRSVIVLDSQGDLIRKLEALSLFAPDAAGSLSDRFMLIDPTDIEHPPALNLFDPGVERLANYSPRERELAFNSLVDIYGRFFGALLGAELTARQSAVFRYLARLMLTIDGATIHTLIDLMDDPAPFKDQIRDLDPTARRFFEKEFSRPTFNATRQQIKQRLYAVLSIPTFDRLFSAPHSKVSFFDALNEGSIVLVHTAKDLLKTDGAAIFGRFVLSLIEHAVMERATLLEADRTPTFLYVDEAQDYFDETIETLLVQGRKFNFGLTIAHQNLAQLSPRLRAVIMGNTTIKLAGGVSDSDARALAPDMRAEKEQLLSARKTARGSEFALSVRNLTAHAITIHVPFGTLECEPTQTNEQHAELLARNREQISYVPQATEGAASVAADECDTDTEHARHVDIQQALETLAKDRGFSAEREHALPNRQRIDLALFGHGQSIAIEVSVTNKEAYELGNIEKALDAEFDQVWMIADDPEHRENIAAQVRQALSPSRLSRVTFGSSSNASTWLSQFEAFSRIAEGTVIGYSVGTHLMPPPSPQDHAYRLAQLQQALSSD